MTENHPYPHVQMPRKNSELALAAALGAAVAALFLSPRRRRVLFHPRGQHDSNKTEIGETLQHAFGEINDELEQSYWEVKASIQKKVRDFEEEAELTKENYNEIVEDVVHRFSKAKEWTEDSTNELIHSLQNQWQSLKQKVN